MSAELDAADGVEATDEERLSDDQAEAKGFSLLNESIQDLLSKIERVREDHENRPPLPQPPALVHTHSAPDGHQPQLQLKEPNLLSKLKESLSPLKPSKQNPIDRAHNPQIQRNLKQFKSAEKFSFQRSSGQRGISFNRSRSPTLTLKRIRSLFSPSAGREIDGSRVVKVSSPISSKTSSQAHTPPRPQKAGPLSLRDFELGDEIGSGKFGSVYVCRHRQTGMLFALKKVFKSTIRQHHMQGQLAMELKILYKLDHSHIVRLYGHFHDDYHVFLLMEYLPGGELMARLGSQEQFVSRVMAQMIDAVSYMHQHGVVHRDIKPENIVLGFGNTAKLCDFGWAGTYDYTCLRTTFCGTLDYVSPEMKDLGKYDSSVDLWSLGVLTYELLMGVTPFKEEIANWRKGGGRLSQAWNWHIDYPQQVSALAESFMRNLLKQNPDDRANLYLCRGHFFIHKYQEKPEETNMDILGLFL